jgi:CTP:molybdopterin cytidylyltransferase MocA
VPAGAVLLAAGAGARFRAAGGGRKLLAPWNGTPLLEWPLRALAAAGLADRVVVLGDGAEEILAAVDLHGARAIVNPHHAQGMATSLRAGLAALDPACEAAIVALGDGPRLHPDAIERVLDALAEAADGIAAASYGGVRGHPVALMRDAWSRLPLSGEAGGRALGGALLVPCDDLGAPGDVDTPDDL